MEAIFRTSPRSNKVCYEMHGAFERMHRMPRGTRQSARVCAKATARVHISHYEATQQPHSKLWARRLRGRPLEDHSQRIRILAQPERKTWRFDPYLSSTTSVTPAFSIFGPARTVGDISAHQANKGTNMLYRRRALRHRALKRARTNSKPPKLS
jgi:hypothetical protein